MPVGTCTTCSTPGIPFAFAASKDRTLPPKVGARATTAVRSPGNLTSIPNFAWPVTFSRESRRRTRLPMSFQSFASLSFTFAGGVSRAAASASCP